MATNHCSRPKIRGFSLVEMAVVLAIVGLLVGGVLAGQSLLKGQRLRAVLTDATTYATAVNQFKIKYGDLPGDFPTATNVWGRMNSNADCVSNASVAVNGAGTGACDGNGDGFLLYGSAASRSTEAEQLWRQLSLAGLIGGQYTGLNGPGNANYDIRPGVNTPVGSLPNSTFWFFGYWGVRGDDGLFFAGDYANTMIFGTALANDWPHGPALLGQEAFELDAKADDGSPATGSIRTLARSWQLANNAVSCTSSDTGSSAVYTKSDTAPTCFIVFLNTFMRSKEQLR